MMTRSCLPRRKPITGCWRRTRRMPMPGTTWASVCRRWDGKTCHARYFERAKELKRYNKDRYRKRNLDTMV